MSPSRRSVPPSTTVGPVYAFAPTSVTVFVPVFVKPRRPAPSRRATFSVKSAAPPALNVDAAVVARSSPFAAELTQLTSPKSTHAPTPMDEQAFVAVKASTCVFALAKGPARSSVLRSKETGRADVLVIAFVTVSCTSPGAKTSCPPAATVTGPVPSAAAPAAVTVGAPPARPAWSAIRRPPEKVLAAFSATRPFPVSARRPVPSTTPFSTTCASAFHTLTSVSSSSVVTPLKTLVLFSPAYSAPRPSPPPSPR